jgi:hypothetical protein
MRTNRLVSPGILLLFLLTALMVAPASDGLQAQSGRPSVVLQGGGWLVDLDATVGALRAELPMGQSGRWLLVPGITFAHGDLRTSSTQTDAILPEAHFHFQLTRGRFRPYVGGGAGVALVDLSNRTIHSVVTASSGLRMDLSQEWGARVEADLRFFGSDTGSIGWGLGIARRF